MTASVTGALGPPMLDGFLLSGAVDVSRDVTFKRQKAVVSMARGNRREAYAYQGAGYPLIGRRYEVTLRYEHIRSHLDLVEELMETPGPHELVIWQRIHSAYAGDGARTTFFMHRAPLVVTPASYSFPGTFMEAEKAALGVEAGIGLQQDGTFATPYTVQQKTQGDYDGGNPTGVQAWFVPETLEFKVGTAPLAGETLYVRLVPILQVFETETVTKSYPPAVKREPRDLIFLEQ